MRQVGPRAPVFGPGEILTIGQMFARGSDTLDIARVLKMPESAVANHLAMARAARAQFLQRKEVAAAEAPL